MSRAHVRPGVGGGLPGRHALVVRHVEVVVEVAPVRGVPREAGETVELLHHDKYPEDGQDRQSA